MKLDAKIIGILIIVAILSGVVLVGDYMENKRAALIPLGVATDAESEIKTTEEPALFKVYIVGEVKSPGMYQVEVGSRVADVVVLAGGLTELAVPLNNNLARQVKDGEKVLILGSNPQTADFSEVAGRINLNTATLEELDQLHGIGPVLAKRILDDRQANGLYNEVQDILRVKGIGQSKLNLFIEQVCVY